MGLESEIHASVDVIVRKPNPECDTQWMSCDTQWMLCGLHAVYWTPQPLTLYETRALQMTTPAAYETNTDSLKWLH